MWCSTSRRFAVPQPPSCTSCHLAESDLRHSVLGGTRGSGHRDTRPVPRACRAAQENRAAAARPPTPAAAASAGSWQPDRQGAGSIPCFPWLLLLSWPGLVAPSVCPSARVQGLAGRWSHTHVCQPGGSLQQEVLALGVYMAPCVHRRAACTSTHMHMHTHVQLHRHMCTHLYSHTSTHTCPYMHGCT